MVEIRTIINRCDKAMYAALCGMIFFIPISSALVEWMFGISLIAYLTKRSYAYKATLKEKNPYAKDSPFFERLKFCLVHFKPPSSCINKPVTFYLVVCCLSIFVSYDPLMSFKALFFKILQVVFTAFFVIEAVNAKGRLKVFTGIYLSSIMLIVLNGLYQYNTHEGFIRNRVILDGRVLSSFHHANDFASYLVLAIPILVALSVLLYISRQEKRDVYLEQSDQSSLFNSYAFIIFCSILLILSVLALGLTYSRGGWLACGISLFALFFKRRKLLTIFIILGVLFLSIFVVKMVKERTINIGGSYANLLNTSDRAGNWINALTMIKEHPILGVGINNYTDLAHSYGFRRAEYPHNCFLQITAELGLAGLFTFCWIFFTLFKDCLGKLKLFRERFTYHLLLGLLTGFIGFLIHSFFDTTFFSTQLSSYMWMMIGLAVAVPKIELEAAS